jgi:hypothetical protein
MKKHKCDSVEVPKNSWNPYLSFKILTFKSINVPHGISYMPLVSKMGRLIQLSFLHTGAFSKSNIDFSSSASGSERESKREWEVWEQGGRHRYLMTRLCLQVVYLWRHVSSTAPPFILWWGNFEILLGPLHRISPLTGELRCQAIQMEHGLI